MGELSSRRNSYVKKFFTRRFWDGRVDRYGISAFRPKSHVGLRVKETRGLNDDELPLAAAMIRPPWLEVSDVTDKSETDDPFLREDGIFIGKDNSESDSEDQEREDPEFVP